MDENNSGSQNGGLQNNDSASSGQESGVVANSQPQPETQSQQNAQASQVQPTAQVQSTAQPQPQSQPVVPTSQPIDSATVNAVQSAAVPDKQKKSYGVLIVVIIAVALVLVAVIIALVVVLTNNNSSKSQTDSKSNNSHYEEDDESSDDGDYSSDGGHGGWDDDSGDVDTIKCLGFEFEKQLGYTYTCNSDGDLQVSSSSFAMYVELIPGMSYYQAEGNVAALTAQLEEDMTVNGATSYTASTGRKMLVFDVVRNGYNIYFALTTASSSSVLGMQVANDGVRPTTSDLETAARLLGESTVASRLPEDESGDNGSLPTVDWNQYLKMPELQK